MLNDTIAAVATAPGRAGISVIRVSGKNAYVIAEKVFVPRQKGRTLQGAKGYTALFGNFVLGAQVLDEGIALCFRAPHSYTGEDVVELSCHGGPSITESVLQSCFLAGARPAAAGEFTRRAVMNGRLSLTQAEAVMDMINAESRRAAGLAKSAMDGTLYRKIQEMKEQLLVLAGHLAAWTDYPEEDVEPVDKAAYLQTISSIKTALEQLIDGYRAGDYLRRGVAVAIVGSPNVGKSTLFNLLCGQPDAIVAPLAGTTRDVLRQRIEIDGISFYLADTAGLRATGDLVEKEGVRRSRQEMEKAGLILAVFDGSQPLDAGQRALAEDCIGRPALAILNKSDMGNKVEESEIEDFFTRVLTISAHRDDARRGVEEAMLAVLALENVDADAGSLANSRQLSAAIAARDALAQAQQAMESGLTFDAASVCVDDALRQLAALAGEDATEAVIAEIFEKFCVGK